MATNEFMLRRILGLIETHCTSIFLRDLIHCGPPFPCCALYRIDVDFSLYNALRMALVFRELNLQATFFFRLHAKQYNLRKDSHKKIVRAIANMGFEIGLHEESLIQAHRKGRNPEDILVEDIETLENIANVNIYGVASHGEDYPEGVNNLDFWKNHTPEEFYLLYQAYDSLLFNSCYYVSNTGKSRWKAYYKGKLTRPTTLKTLPRTIAFSASEHNIPLYLVLHPVYWEFPKEKGKKLDALY